MVVATCEVLLLGLLIAGAVLDVTTFRLPNWLTAATAVVGLLWLLLTLPAIQFIVLNLAVAAIMLGVGLLAFRFNVLGGGDVKWLASLALWIGMHVDIVRFLFLTTGSGAALALIVLVISKYRPGYGKQDGKQHLPYGVAIAVAGIDYWFRRTGLGHGVMALFAA